MLGYERSQSSAASKTSAQTLSKDWQLAREMVERAVRELADPRASQQGSAFGLGNSGGTGEDDVAAIQAMAEVHESHLLIQVRKGTLGFLCESSLGMFFSMLRARQFPPL